VRNTQHHVLRCGVFRVLGKPPHLLRAAILIVLVLYGVSKIVTDAANNTAASAPQTTDEASRAL
jgi:hypothetical protein